MIWRQKEFVEKYEDVRANTAKDTYSMLQAQLQNGDIIVGLNTSLINSIDDLHKLLDEKSIGQAIQLEVLRKGKKEKVRVIPAELKN